MHSKKYNTIKTLSIILLLILIKTTFQSRSNEEEQTEEQTQEQKKNKKNTTKEILKNAFYIILIILLGIGFIIILISIIAKIIECLSNILKKDNPSFENQEINPTTENNILTNYLKTNASKNELTKEELITIILKLIEIENGDEKSCEFIINNCFVRFLYSINKDNFKQNCSICLDPIHESEYSFKTHCQHIFHKNCITKYLLTEINEKKIRNDGEDFDIFCPNCKSSLLVMKKKEEKNKKIKILFGDACSSDSLEQNNRKKDIEIYNKTTIISVIQRTNHYNIKERINVNNINDTI